MVKQPPVEEESSCSELIFLKKSKDLRFMLNKTHVYFNILFNGSEF